MGDFRSRSLGVIASIGVHLVVLLSLPRARAVVVSPPNTARNSITVELSVPISSKVARVQTQETHSSLSAALDTSLNLVATARTVRPDVAQQVTDTVATDTPAAHDDREADLRAAQLMRAFVQTGPVGVASGGGPGNPSDATVPALGTTRTAGPSEDHYLDWYANQRDRIKRVLVFPRGRQITMDQGTTLLGFAVGRDGGLVEAPRVLRSSGFSDLDAAALTAVLRSAPFAPLPDDIAPTSRRIRLTVPIQFWNPTVH